MKLKKIASLALAGIMAVSMLAGCKDGTNQEEPSSSSQVPATTNVVTYANDALSAAEKGVFTFKSSSELDTILQAAANDKDKFASKDIKTVYGNTNNVFDKSSNELKSVYNAVKDKVSTNSIVITDTTDLDKAAPNGKDQKMVRVLAISGALDEKTAITKVVDDFTKDYSLTTTFPAEITGTPGYDCDYTAEISAVKVSSVDNAANTAWVVAIVITQSVTEAANVQ